MSQATAIRQQPITVSMDQAFLESLDIVINGLKERGEQWSSEAKQDMVSTLFLSAQKAGHLGMWTAPRLDIVPPRTTASAEPLRSAPPVPPAPDPAVRSDAPTRLPLATAASSSPIGRRGVLEAIARVREELPWPTFHFILKDFGVSDPEDLPNQLIAEGCYLVLQRARDHYRRKAADPTSFEHFEASL